MPLLEHVIRIIELLESLQAREIVTEELLCICLVP